MADRYRHFVFIVFVFSLFLFQTGYCNSNAEVAVRTIQKLDTLPQNDVQCLFKDSRGFIWIGTLDGLHRFDGYEYQSYRVKKGGGGINSNLIMSVREDSKGHIWIATFGKGICRLNLQTQEFISFLDHNDPVLSKIPDDIACFWVDEEDFLWVGSYDEMFRIQLNETLDQAIEVVSVLKDQLINSICQDDFGTIWAGSNGALYEIQNPNDVPDQLEVKELPYSARSITPFEHGVIAGGSMVTAVCIDRKKKDKDYRYYVINTLDEEKSHVDALHFSQNVLWVGDRTGLRCMVRDEDGRWNFTELFQMNDFQGSLYSNIVTTIISDDFGQIWIGTRGGGVTMIREEPTGFNRYHQTTVAGSLSNNLTRSVFVDHKDNVWIGTEEGGLNLLRSDSPSGYRDGFEQIQVNPVDSENRVYAVAERMTPNSSLRDSLIYVGCSYPTNIAAIDPETLEVIPNPLGAGVIGFVFTIEVGSDGTLWAGTYMNGLWRFKTNEDGIIVESKQFLSDLNDSNTLISSIIRDLHIDQQGNIWISTDKGLSVLESTELTKQNPVFKRFFSSGNDGDMPHDYLLQIFESSDGQIWIGTMGGGLIQVIGNPSKKDLRFQSITTDNGLLNDSVKSIQEDEAGNLWLASNKGLARYDPSSKQITHFDFWDGLQDDEFSEICSGKRADGQMIFGGRKGFNTFYPERIRVDDIPPKLYINRFLISNKEVSIGDDVNGRVLLEKSIECVDSLRLKHFENDISIGFVGLHFRSPKENHYVYKLKGYDKDWVPSCQDTRVAKYTNLDPGEYVFQVKGSNSEGIWVQDPTVLKITIKPPFWETILFRIFVVIIGGFIIVVLYWRHIAHLHRQKVQLETKVRYRTRQLRVLNEDLSNSNAMKDKFFSIIAHDLRAPFASFIGLTEIMVDDIGSMPIDEIQTLAKSLNHSSTELFNLLENLLHWARVQQGMVSFELVKTDFNLVFEEVVEQYRGAAEKKDISLLNDVSKEIFVVTDINVLRTVLRNLISNAVKFTPRGGRIRGYLNLQNQSKIEFGIEDNGIGMNEELLDQLFCIDIKSNRLGTEGEASSGLGLILCKEFIEKVKGELRVESQENVGTTFYISIPMRAGS